MAEIFLLSRDLYPFSPSNLPYLFLNDVLDFDTFPMTFPSCRDTMQRHFSGVPRLLNGQLHNTCRLAASAWSTRPCAAFTLGRAPVWITLLSIHLLSLTKQWLLFLCQTRLTLLSLLVSYWEAGKEKEKGGTDRRVKQLHKPYFLRKTNWREVSSEGHPKNRCSPSPVPSQALPSAANNRQSLRNGMHSPF